MKRWTWFLLMVVAWLPVAAQNSDWMKLFNGNDLSGWKHVGDGEFTVENGLLRAQGGMGLLYWESGKLGNCVIRVVYRMEHPNDNSGVFIRIPEKPTEAWMPVNRGYEVQIDNTADDFHATGVLYSLTKALARPGHPGPEWNTMEITLDGPHTKVVVNGVKVTDYFEGQLVPPKEKPYEPDRGRRPMEGYIGLQNHNAKDVVYFKEVAVKKLK